MVSTEKIALKFSQIDEYLGLLRQISKSPLETFLHDKITIGSAKYYLQISIECCLDVFVGSFCELNVQVIDSCSFTEIVELAGFHVSKLYSKVTNKMLTRFVTI